MDGSLFSIAYNVASSPIRDIRVAVPVRDEEARITRLLDSLSIAAANVSLPVTVVILANDCRDGTVERVRGFHHPRLAVVLHEIALSPDRPSAGHARRKAMDLAALPGSLLMTTDADAVVAKDWINAALRGASAGADIVCGRIEADLGHILTQPSISRIAGIEAPYGSLIHEVRHKLDQMAGRQAPGGSRPHYIESGASIAIRSDAYLAIGGMPHMRSSEDRGLVFRGERQGLRVTYADDMGATVSARLHGRAEGGMAACLLERLSNDDPLADQAMLPVVVIRELWRRAVSGQATGYPNRSRRIGRPLRASDLEREIAVLEDFVEHEVRPGFAEWAWHHQPVTVA